VLVLIPGQPGGPEDWLLAGRLARVMDAFAAAHDGLAPVVVVPDVTGSPVGNSLCMDSRLGAAETYLAEDVPAWAAANLQVDVTHLAIGGFSFGGTCALQLAVRRPEVYPTFLDVSGQAEPTLGDPALTVQTAFGGDVAAFRRVNPLDELSSMHLPGTAGTIAVGRDDPVFRPQAEQVAIASRAAGITVALEEFPGGHSWATASAALTTALPWISGRARIVDPVPAPSMP
jgi:S-formylglutathione hydrolase FrmB